MQVPSLGWEDILVEGMAVHSSILAWRIPWTEETGGYSPWGRRESDTIRATEHACTFVYPSTCSMVSVWCPGFGGYK